MVRFSTRTKILLSSVIASLALSGCDSNGNDGNNGTNGTNGANGATGANGLNSVTNMMTLVAGDDCRYGGVAVQVGLDDNSNGVLDQPEVDSQSNVCGGPTEKDLLPANAELVFEGVDAPATNMARRDILVSPVSAKVGGVLTSLDVRYHTLARSGDEFGNVTFGQLVNSEGQPLFGEDGEQNISNSNEYTSILPVGDRLFSLSQIESRPGAMFLMELNQDTDTGELSVKEMWQVDQSGVNGGWVHCAGSVSPWGTHLASEEYEPNAATLVTGANALADAFAAPFLDYFNKDESHWNPYQLGWTIEAEVKAAGKAAPTVALSKHYSMGRMAFELSYVMPDKKTVYMTDDGTNVGLFMYVASTAGDLSSGHLYAMKWIQTSADHLGAATFDWIDLGVTTDDEIKPFVDGDDQVAFTDIFDKVAPVAGVCANGFTSVNTNGLGQECLKVKAGMEKVASRLETRRYAAMLGASTEMNKEEGITFDPTRNKLYLAISSVERGMEDFKRTGSANTSFDGGGANDMKLSGYNLCGAVYQLDVAADAAIGSDYVAKNMSVLVAGIPAATGIGSDPVQANPEVFNNSSNQCHIDGIASPDNVTYMDGYDILIIGEDTAYHQNDVIWAYNLSDGTMKRIQTTPYGAETTSPYWYPNVNGWAYLTSVVQHPYDESDTDKNTGAGENRAYTGYIGPFLAKAPQ